VGLASCAKTLMLSQRFCARRKACDGRRSSVLLSYWAAWASTRF